MRTPEERRVTREHIVQTTVSVVIAFVAIATFYYLRADREADAIEHIQKQQATNVAKIDQLEHQVDRLVNNIDKVSVGIEHVSTLLEGFDNGKGGARH